MNTLKRREILANGVALAGSAALGFPAIAQGKPEKLVVVGINAKIQGALIEEVAPEFERRHGIKVEFNMLPLDALSAKLRTELNAGSDAIDILQWNPDMTGWIAPHLEDHAKLLREFGGKHPDFDWADFMPSVKAMATYAGKLQGIPFRVTAPVLHYQKHLLDAAGIAKPPTTFAELRAAGLATTAKGQPNRYGIGLMGRQGAALVVSFAPYLFSAGGKFYNAATGEIFINRAEAVAALDFFGGLLARDKVVPPEAITWEFNELIAGGQADRYAMSVAFAPYGTLLNDPTLSKTGGKWAWALVPGAENISQSTTTLGGWSFAVPNKARHKEWAFELIMMATNKRWMLRGMELGNAPPRRSVLLDPAMQERFGWAPVSVKALERAEGVPTDPLWPSFDQRLRIGIAQTLLGQASAKQALDAVASDWERMFRRAGITR